MTSRISFDDTATIAHLAATSTSLAQVLRAMGYAPGSASARTRLERAAAAAGIALPVQGSPFADRAKVCLALTSCTTRAEAAAFLGASAGGKTYHRLDELADELGVPRLPTSPAGNRTDRRARPKGADERDALASASPAELQAAWSTAHSQADLLVHFGLAPTQRNVDVLAAAAAAAGLEVPNGRMSGPRPADVLVIGEVVSQDVLRRLVVRHGLLDPDVCDDCGQPSNWRGRPMTLELDHINGDRTDNRLENLRFLCPNCHAITDTFRGRNRRPATATTTAR